MDFIYDKETLYSLMNDFYAITKIKTVIFDVNYKSIVTVPEYDSDFRSAIHESKTATEKIQIKMPYIPALAIICCKASKV